MKKDPREHIQGNIDAARVALGPRGNLRYAEQQLREAADMTKALREKARAA